MLNTDAQPEKRRQIAEVSISDLIFLMFLLRKGWNKPRQDCRVVAGGNAYTLIGTQPGNALKIEIAENSDIVTLALFQESPHHPELSHVLRVYDGMFFEEPGDEDWTMKENPLGLTMERRLWGPFGLCLAHRFVSRVASDISNAYALAMNRFAKCGKAQPQDVPCPSVSVVFNGQTVKDLDELDKLIEGTSAYAYPLGQFTLSQPRMCVTDPCYALNRLNTGTLQAEPGCWSAVSEVGPTDWHFRVKALAISHESFGPAEILPMNELEFSGLTAEVDSAQCGFFDEALYPVSPIEFDYETGTFYEACCSLTLDRSLPGGGIVRNMGVATSSGFGDGCYNVYVKRNASGNIVYAQIVFVDGPMKA